MKPQAFINYKFTKIEVEIILKWYPVTILRKSIKWYHEVAVELVPGTAMVNAWILYNISIFRVQYAINYSPRNRSYFLSWFGSNANSHSWT